MERARSITARLTSSSVTLILFFSPISDSTRPRRTRRSAIFWYSSLAASSVVFSSAKVLPDDSISALIESHISLNSSATSDGGASNLWLSSSRSSSVRLTRWPLARGFLQLVERFQAERFCKLVVDPGLTRSFDHCRRGFKLGRLAGQLFAG